MNYLVILDGQAGELEKILSGTKTMIAKALDPARAAAQPVSPGDSLYFLRHKDEHDLRVTATVIRVLYFTSSQEEDLSQLLKELQPRLQLTEDQYNNWSTQEQVLLVEFEGAHKVDVIHVDSHKFTHRSDWVVFRNFHPHTE